MIDYWIDEHGSEGRTIVFMDEDENGPIERIIPLAAISNRREMLGLDDPLEALKALIHIQRHGEPEPDPQSGFNAWTDVHTALSHREQAREDSAINAKSEGATPTVMMERASQAAYAAVHQPIDGGECLLDRLRAEARSRLGVADPESKCGEETRTVRPQVSTLRAAPFGPMTIDRHDDELMVQALQGQEGYLLECTQRFLHSLSSHSDDPITPQHEPPAPASIDELKRRYQEASQ